METVAALKQWWRDRCSKGEPFTPTDADLRRLTEHLFYEVQMTFDLAHVLTAASSAPPASPAELLVRNALLEAFTIHTRQLIDFFWSSRSPGRMVTVRDAYAADYFHPGEWRCLRPARPAALDRVLLLSVIGGRLADREPRDLVAEERLEKHDERVRVR